MKVADKMFSAKNQRELTQASLKFIGIDMPEKTNIALHAIKTTRQQMEKLLQITNQMKKTTTQHPQTSERVTIILDNLLRFIHLRYISLPHTSQYCDKLKTSITEICKKNTTREPMYYRSIMHLSQNKSRMPYAVKITSKKSEPNSPNSVSRPPLSYPAKHTLTTRSPSPLRTTKENYFLSAVLKLLHAKNIRELVIASKEISNSTPGSKSNRQTLNRITLTRHEIQNLMKVVTTVMPRTNSKPQFAKKNIFSLDNLLRIIHLVNAAQPKGLARLEKQVESCITSLCAKHQVETPRHLLTYQHSSGYHGRTTISQLL